MQQRLIGSTLQKKQLCFKAICAVEEVTVKCVFAGKQVTVKSSADCWDCRDCCSLPNAL